MAIPTLPTFLSAPASPRTAPPQERFEKSYVQPDPRELAAQITERYARIATGLREFFIGMQGIQKDFTHQRELEDNKYKLSLEDSFTLSSSIKQFAKICDDLFQKAVQIQEAYRVLKQQYDELLRLDQKLAQPFTEQLERVVQEQFQIGLLVGTTKKSLADELNHHLVAFIKLTDRETKKLCDYWHEHTDSAREIWLTAKWLKKQLEDIQTLRNKHVELDDDIKDIKRSLDSILQQQTSDVNKVKDLFESLQILIDNTIKLAKTKSLNLEEDEKPAPQVEGLINQVQTEINKKKVTESLTNLKALWEETQKKLEAIDTIESPKALKELMDQPKKILAELQKLKDFIWKQKLKLILNKKYLNTLPLDARASSAITQKWTDHFRAVGALETSPFLKTNDQSFAKIRNDIHVTAQPLFEKQVDKCKTAWERLSDEEKKLKYKDHLADAKILKSAISETRAYFEEIKKTTNSDLRELITIELTKVDRLVNEITEFAFDNDLPVDGEALPLLQRGAQIFTAGVPTAFQGAGIGACVRAGASLLNGPGYNISAAIASASIGATAGFFIGNKPYYNLQFWKGYNWNQGMRMAGISALAGLALQGLSTNLLTVIPKQNHDIAAWSLGLFGIIPAASLVCDTIQGIYSTFTSCCHSSKKEIEGEEEVKYQDPKAPLKETKTASAGKKTAVISEEKEQTQTTWGEWAKSPLYWARRTLKTNTVPRFIVGLTALYATGTAIKTAEESLEKRDWAAIPTGVFGNIFLGAAAGALSAWQWNDRIQKVKQAVEKIILQNKVIQAFKPTKKTPEQATNEAPLMQQAPEEKEPLHEVSSASGQSPPKKRFQGAAQKVTEKKEAH